MGKGLDKTGQLVEVKRGAVSAHAASRKEKRAWDETKAAAERALGSTDYLALSDRRSMTDAEKTYRDALREIIKSAPTGTPPALPKL